MPRPPDTIWKSGQFTVRKCTVNTVENKKSGIEAGYKDEDTEKPLVQIFNSVITGGKGIGITQNANPYYSSFYTTVENCTISDIDPGRYPIRIEYWDTGTLGEIKNVLCLCPSDYNITLLICPVGEYDTDDNAVNYTGNNRWRIGTVLQDSFCVAPNLDYFED